VLGQVQHDPVAAAVRDPGRDGDEVAAQRRRAGAAVIARGQRAGGAQQVVRDRRAGQPDIARS
jgi:hypothetical protein